MSSKTAFPQFYNLHGNKRTIDQNIQGPVDPLMPPRRATLPLWLALLLKRQRRANILPPSWLHPEPLSLILDIETQHDDYQHAFSPPPPLPGQPSLRDRNRDRSQQSVAVPRFTPDGERLYASPPFLPQNVAQEYISPGEPPALPYHWLEVGNMLLDAASDDLVDPNQTRRLLKELREVRMAKIRAGVDVLDDASTGGGGVALTGVGAMEVGEGRGFVTGVVDGLRYVACSFRVLVRGAHGGVLFSTFTNMAQKNRRFQRTSTTRTAGRRYGQWWLRCHSRR